MVDIFSLLLGVVSICALAAAISKILLTPPKVWDDDDWKPEEIEAFGNSDELQNRHPHMWMDDYSPD